MVRFAKRTQEDMVSKAWVDVWVVLLHGSKQNWKGKIEILLDTYEVSNMMGNRRNIRARDKVCTSKFILRKEGRCVTECWSDMDDRAKPPPWIYP